MSHKSIRKAPIPINRDVVEDLVWFDELLALTNVGIRFVDTTRWDDESANLVVWTHASLRMALSFVFSNNTFVYQINPQDDVKTDIFFLEMMAILSAIDLISAFDHPPKRILLHTDSLDSVCIFNSLHANQPIHNAPLKAIARIIIESRMDLRV
ncbi:hypothetical protein C0991_010908 [Blastosporella zonata]|nr:hypothetical protein C0991_010908 [Blastosporella zonata]